MSEGADKLGQAYAGALERALEESPGLEPPLPDRPLPDRDAASAASSFQAPSAEADQGGESPAPPPEPLRILEALLFVGGSPLDAKRAGEVIRGLTPEHFTEAIDALNHAYRRQGRPYAIQPKDNGYLLTLRPSFHGVIEKIYGGPREARLSTAAVDTLALVAYRQPATKAEIDGLRGAESGSLLRQLVRRGLVEVVYRADSHDREVSYGTTKRFLEMFGLESLDDLPRTQDLQQM